MYEKHSFFELNDLQQSIDALNKALKKAENLDKHLEILDEYTEHLIQRNYWDVVQKCCETALKVAPRDEKWLERQKLAYDALNSDEKEITIPSTNTSSTGANPLDTADGVTNQMPATDVTMQQTSTLSPAPNIAKAQQLPLIQSVHPTKVLDNFTQRTMPSHDMRQMFQRRSSRIALFLDITVMPIIFSLFIYQLFSISSIRIVVASISALLIVGFYLWGWFTKRDWLSLVFPFIFGLLWAVYCGYFVSFIFSQLELFNGATNTLLYTYAPFIIAALLFLVETAWHHELFRGKK